VLLQDIFRKYPNRYESIISLLCENLSSLDEPEAKASMIWIIGEYAERIDNAGELLDGFGFKVSICYTEYLLMGSCVLYQYVSKT